MEVFLIKACSGENNKEHIFPNSYYREWVVALIEDKIQAELYLEKLNNIVKNFPIGTYIGNKVSVITEETSFLDPKSNHSCLGTFYLLLGPMELLSDEDCNKLFLQLEQVDSKNKLTEQNI